MDPRLQYLEIGAGLGEFIPYLIESLKGKLTKKPIIIDFADHFLMLDMLWEARKLGLGSLRNDRLETLINRATIVLDKDRVSFINLRLGQALQLHPELETSADVIVDQCGAILYILNERQTLEGVDTLDLGEAIKQLERRLLKKGGMLIIDPP